MDGFGNLVCRHWEAGKRQFTQDQLWYVPTRASPARLFGMIRFGIADGNFPAEHIHRRSKSFLPGFDQPGFLSFLFAQGQEEQSGTETLDPHDVIVDLMVAVAKSL